MSSGKKTQVRVESGYQKIWVFSPSFLGFWYKNNKNSDQVGIQVTFFRAGFVFLIFGFFASDFGF